MRFSFLFALVLLCVLATVAATHNKVTNQCSLRDKLTMKLQALVNRSPRKIYGRIFADRIATKSMS